MGIMDWYDTNHDGHYSGAEIDRFQLDHAEYPGMFERANDRYDWDDDDRYDDPYASKSKKKRSSFDAASSLDYLIDEDEDDDDEDDDEDDWDDWDDEDDEDEEDDDDDDGLEDDEDLELKNMKINVVGTAYEDRADIWIAAQEAFDYSVELSRDYGNAYDDNAIAVTVDGEMAGYLPRNVAKKLAPIMDDGADIEVTKVKIKDYVSRDGKDRVNVTLTLEMEQ